MRAQSTASRVSIAWAGSETSLYRFSYEPTWIRTTFLPPSGQAQQDIGPRRGTLMGFRVARHGVRLKANVVYELALFAKAAFARECPLPLHEVLALFSSLHA
jgi:hypothetical protein